MQRTSLMPYLQTLISIAFSLLPVTILLVSAQNSTPSKVKKAHSSPLCTTTAQTNSSAACPKNKRHQVVISCAKFQPNAVIKSHSLVAQKHLFNEYTLCIILTYIHVTVLLVVQRLLKFQSK